MNVTVLMASGETDEWEGVADAIDDRGSLIVLAHIEGNEISGDIKTMVLVREGSVQGTEKSEVFQVMAQYAPGMWIKVEFE